tara:strand:+ start:136 stop:744 length:609 start_codon:yes stop_codon:yes gene_type:complete
MAFSTYSELQALVANYLARDDLTTQIIDFIQLGEVRLRRDLRLREMLTTTDLTVNAQEISIPTDFLELREIHIDSNPVTQLDYLVPTAFFRNARIGETGKPVFYTATGSKFIFGPNPDTSYTAKLLYYQKPDLLSDSNTSNVFLTTCPDALLYATLAESEPFLMNDERVAIWASLYDRARIQLTSSDDRAEFSGNPMVMSTT